LAIAHYAHDCFNSEHGVRQPKPFGQASGANPIRSGTARLRKRASGGQARAGMASMTSRRGDMAEEPEEIAVLEERTEGNEAGEPRRAFVQSLERGLAVVRAFDAGHPSLTLSEVARMTGLDRAATRRFLYTFVDLGYMRREGRLFSLRPKLLELGYAYLSSLRLPELAEPHLRMLSEQVRESSYVSIKDENDNICVAHVPVRRIWTATITIGTRLPLLATGSGRVLLSGESDEAVRAFLAAHPVPQITPHTKRNPDDLAAEIALTRKQGFAFVDQELEEGLRVVAAPVRDPSGKVIAAVSVSTLASSFTPEAVLREMLPPVLRAAAMIEVDLTSLMRSGIGGRPSRDT
jgi:IclR family transcriptional regulator, pca regulon regulatory protein